ncbi:hypothetical protein CMO96_04010 [Candidatus Woesebacteria bacterium]|nr:hypothetical protein [Candidatus Woesebacteria bacterium]
MSPETPKAITTESGRDAYKARTQKQRQVFGRQSQSSQWRQEAGAWAAILGDYIQGKELLAFAQKDGIPGAQKELRRALLDVGRAEGRFEYIKDNLGADRVPPYEKIALLRKTAVLYGSWEAAITLG